MLRYENCYQCEKFYEIALRKYLLDFALVYVCLPQEVISKLEEIFVGTDGQANEDTRRRP